LACENDATVVDGAHRFVALNDQGHRVPHRRADVEARSIVFASRRVAHDPPQCQHMATRDIAHEVCDVLVGGRADELLRRSELHDRAVAHDRDPVAEP